MKERWRWGIMGLALLVLGGWLFGSNEMAPATASAPNTASKGARPEGARSAKRARYRTTPAVEMAPAAEQRGAAPIDPLLAAIPASAIGVVVLEARSLFALPAGQLLARCLERSRNFRAPIDDIDKVERMAFAQLDDGRSMGILLGELSDASQPSTSSAAAQAYGDRAQLFDARRAADEPDPSQTARRPSAVWDHKLWLYGDNADDLRGAVDRLEGRTREPSSIAANDDYGDVHGRVRSDFLGMLLPPEIADSVANAGVQLEFHVDASDDLLVTIDAIGEAAKTRELGRRLESALAALRTHAASDRRLSGLLESYTLRTTADGLRLEAVLSLELVGELLGPCAAGG
jgi:hypothetical protein